MISNSVGKHEQTRENERRRRPLNRKRPTNQFEQKYQRAPVHRLRAVYDYAQNGVELKKNLRQYWWSAMVQMHENIVGIDAAIFMHPTTWKASGHVDAFNDPLIDNKDSKKRYRADVLIEEHVEKINKKIEKEVTKAAKRFGDSFDREQFVATNGRVVGYNEKIAAIEGRFKTALENDDLADVKAQIEELGIVDPISGSRGAMTSHPWIRSRDDPHAGGAHMRVIPGSDPPMTRHPLDPIPR